MKAVSTTATSQLQGDNEPSVFKKSYKIVITKRGSGNSGGCRGDPSCRVTSRDVVDGGGGGGGPKGSRIGGASMFKGKRKMAAYHEYKFGGNQVSEALLEGLAELDASAPWFVDSKQLLTTDARIDQNRLQLSRNSPISGIFTAAEKACMNTDDGLMVMAFDRRGKLYTMKCRFFRDKRFCRVMGEWGEFLRDHGLGLGKTEFLGDRRVMVEVWAFRFHTLPNDKEGKNFESGHPDGALGLVVLHHEDEAVEAEEDAAVVVPEHDGWAAAVVQERLQDEAPATVVQEELQEEGPADDACAEHREKGTRAGSYESKLLQVAAAVLLLLRTSNRTKRKRDDDNVGKDDAP